MPYPTKVQLIQRKQSEQWYINFPAAIAQAVPMESKTPTRSVQNIAGRIVCGLSR